MQVSAQRYPTRQIEPPVAAGFPYPGRALLRQCFVRTPTASAVYGAHPANGAIPSGGFPRPADFGSERDPANVGVSRSASPMCFSFTNSRRSFAPSVGLGLFAAVAMARRNARRRPRIWRFNLRMEAFATSAKEVPHPSPLLGGRELKGEGDSGSLDKTPRKRAPQYAIFTAGSASAIPALVRLNSATVDFRSAASVRAYSFFNARLANSSGSRSMS